VAAAGSGGAFARAGRNQPAPADPSPCRAVVVRRRPRSDSRSATRPPAPTHPTKPLAVPRGGTRAPVVRKPRPPTTRLQRRPRSGSKRSAGRQADRKRDAPHPVDEEVLRWCADDPVGSSSRQRTLLGSRIRANRRDRPSGVQLPGLSPVKWTLAAGRPGRPSRARRPQSRRPLLTIRAVAVRRRPRSSSQPTRPPPRASSNH
jgi:hypothetical protein